MKKKFNIMNTKKFNRKQLRAALALLCIVSGSLAAMSFTSSPAEAKAKTETTAGAVYYWFNTNTSGTTVGSAKSNTAYSADPDGCDGDGDYCGLGYSADKTTVDGSGNRILAPGITSANRDVASQQD